MKRALGMLLLAVVLVPSAALAQFDTGAVLGSVRDSTGAVLPGATITLRNVATGVTSIKTTDERGAYEFFTVRAGDYTISAELSGFGTRTITVKVDVGARRRVDVDLSVAAVAEAVSVTAEAPLLETDSSQRGQVITGDQTRALPLNGREYSSLALLTTGVHSGSSNLTTGGTPREGTFNVNGLRSTFNNFLIDGVDNNAYGTSNQGFSNQVMQPPPDAVGEFKVVTNNMSAEYGRAAGATVNVVYQSGGNAFHGSAWEFFRNTALNATGFFKPASGQKPPLTRNQYGGVVGGPIARNRAFFFADFEGFRQNRKVTTPSTIPTPQQRQGILSVPIVDPRTGATYAGRHADSDDGVRAGGSGRLAGYDILGRKQLRRPAGVHQPHRQGRRQSRPPAQSDADDVRSVRLARPPHRGSAADSASLGRQRQRDDLRPQQAAGAWRDLCSERHGALGIPFRMVDDRRRQESAGARHVERVRRIRHHGIARRSEDQRRAADAAHYGLRGSGPAGHQSSVAVPERPQSQGELHTKPRTPFGESRLRVSADRHRSAGREPALRPRHLRRPVHETGRRRRKQSV